MEDRKMVFHPSLGICTITAYDQRSDRVTMVSLEGNQSTLPYANLAKAGVRELMDTTEAKGIIKRILHPTIGDDFVVELAALLKQRDYTQVDMKAMVDVFIYLMNWKYVDGKNGMKNQQCLDRIQELLCEELAFVLHVQKESLIDEMISCYEQKA